MDWIRAVIRLRRDREPGVLVTVADVRGHAPRDAGAKMVVGLSQTWDTVGGGNLEAVAIERARELLAAGAAAPEAAHIDALRQGTDQHGVQCCGGEVTLLLEPLPVVPAVAIFGIGHVGLELARILARHDLELHLVDSRPDQLAVERLAALADAVARARAPGAGTARAGARELPAGTHVLVMTHDHAEDVALCDAALRTPRARLDRADRLVGQVGAVPAEARRRGGHSPGGHRRGSHAHRASWPRRQGARPPSPWALPHHSCFPSNQGDREEHDALPRDRSGHPGQSLHRRRLRASADEGLARARRRDRGPRTVPVGRPSRRGGRRTSARASCCPASSTPTSTSRRSG